MEWRKELKVSRVEGNKSLTKEKKKHNYKKNMISKVKYLCCLLVGKRQSLQIVREIIRYCLSSQHLDFCDMIAWEEILTSVVNFSR